MKDTAFILDSQDGLCLKLLTFLSGVLKAVSASFLSLQRGKG